KSTVEHLNPTRVKLSVEVPFDELKPHFDKAYGALAGQVRIPGFRPGKVPARILDARLGRGTILSEVVNDAVPAKYGEAVTEANLAVLGQPEIEVTRIDDGDALAFTAEVDVRPEITLPSLEDVSITVDDVEVTEADIDEQVEALRDRFATTTVVERAAADGDAISIDLSASVDGEVLDEATTEGLTYTVGAGDLIEGIDEAVTGLSAGESATFPTVLVAGGYAGRDAEVTVTVQSVSERALPDIDDDFAQLASEFDTVEELRTDLAEKIRRVKNRSQAADARDKVLESLLEATEIPAPESIVEAEFKSREHDAVHAFDHDEDALTAHLEREGQSREEFDAELREGAVKAVQVQLLLDALAEDQQIGVSQEEFTERVLYNAQRLGIAPEEYFSRLQEGNQLASVFAEVRRGKALAGAVEKATVSNTSGEVLDVAALFGIETVSEEEQLAEALAEAQAAQETGLSVSEQVEVEVLADEIVAEAEAVVEAEVIAEEVLAVDAELLDEAVAEEVVDAELLDVAEVDVVVVEQDSTEQDGADTGSTRPDSSG
ncbi:MAG TPA: trigger factor, partial [Frankiaceae bacterium]|nr:trigger factor [Frankiaceae bacterium]